MAIETLKKRSSFLRVRGGGRWATGAFVLEGKPRVAEGTSGGQSSAGGDEGEAERDQSRGQFRGQTRGQIRGAAGGQPSGHAGGQPGSPSGDGSIDRAGGRLGVPTVKQAADDLHAARFGFTVTKKLGNAVARNRIRRRLKAAVGQVAPLGARPDCDYVIIARTSALTRPFGSIAQDLEYAFERVHQALRKPGGSGGSAASRGRGIRTKGRDRS